MKNGEVHGLIQALQDDNDPVDEADKEQYVDRG